MQKCIKITVKEMTREMVALAKRISRMITGASFHREEQILKKLDLGVTVG